MGKKIFKATNNSVATLLVAVMLILIMVSATGFVWADKTVYVAVDGQTLTVNTLSSSPDKVLAQADIKLGPKDEYRISSGKITNNSVISVYRAIPVTVTYEGKTTELVTGKPTTGEIVSSMGIDLDRVRVIPGSDSGVMANMNIKVVDVVRKIVERDEVVNRDVVRRADTGLDVGEQKTVQAGSDGMSHVQIEQTYEDGQLVGEKVLTEKIITQATPEIVLVGSNNSVETSRGTERFRQVLTMNASAYLPSDGDGRGITANGMRAGFGIVAVDPSVIPLGTRLYIPSYGYAIAADTGGAIIGNRIDLCMEDYGSAMAFGRRHVKVYVLD